MLTKYTIKDEENKKINKSSYASEEDRFRYTSLEHNFMKIFFLTKIGKSD